MKTFVESVIVVSILVITFGVTFLVARTTLEIYSPEITAAGSF